MVHPVHPVTTDTTSLIVAPGLVMSVLKIRHSAQMTDRAAKVSSTMSLAQRLFSTDDRQGCKSKYYYLLGTPIKCYIQH